jgi:hypothetical protein
MQDSLLYSEMTKLSNYNDDYKIFLLTGIEKKDGLKEFLLDSIFYDSQNNDTLKRCYIFRDNEWKLKQCFSKSFRLDRQLNYFKTERPNDLVKYKREIFYWYDSLNRCNTETSFECSKNRICDSIRKKIYFLSLSNKIDSTQYFYWKENIWVYDYTNVRAEKGK